MLYDDTWHCFFFTFTIQSQKRGANTVCFFFVTVSWGILAIPHNHNTVTVIELLLQDKRVLMRATRESDYELLEYAIEKFPSEFLKVKPFIDIILNAKILKAVDCLL